MRIGFAFCAEGAAHEEILAFCAAARQEAAAVFSGDLQIVVLILSNDPPPRERFADCVIHAHPSFFDKPELTLLRMGSSIAKLDHLVISRFGGRFNPTHLRELLPNHLASRAGASIPQYHYRGETEMLVTIGDLAHDFECYLLASRVGRNDNLDLQPDVFLFSRPTVDELLRQDWRSSRTGFALECSAIILASTMAVTAPTLTLSPYEHKPYPYDQRNARERLRLLAQKFGGLGGESTKRKFDAFCGTYRGRSQSDLITRYTEEVLNKS